MACFLYGDVCQNDESMEDMTFLSNPHGQFGYSHVPDYPRSRLLTYQDVDIEGQQNSWSTQPMDRYLYGNDPSSLSTGVLYANLSHIKTCQSTDREERERQWASCHIFGSSRYPSPDRTSSSGVSSHAQQNPVYSPQSVRYEPDDELHMPYSMFPFSTLLDGGANPAAGCLSGEAIINLRELEYHHSEPEALHDDNVPINTSPQCGYQSEPTHTKPTADDLAEPSSDNYKCYRHHEMNDAVPMAEEVRPISEDFRPLTPDDESDSDYKPYTPKDTKRRRSASSRSSTKPIAPRRNRKISSASTPPTTSTHRITKKSRGPHAALQRTKSAPNTRETERPFPCPLAGYGCASSFVSKNEWKRHFSTQHLKLGFWRCDLCPPVADPKDPSALSFNDFNRKDLFTQHIRRMHFARPDAVRADITTNSNYKRKKDALVTEQGMRDVQERCYMKLRDAPLRSKCLFCETEFEGRGSWEERMEHVGRHLEKDRGRFSLDAKEWIEDGGLEEWFLREGLVERGVGGEWKIGDGRPRRECVEESGDECS